MTFVVEKKKRNKRVLYHGTTTRFLPDILKYGLKKAPGHKSYGSSEGWVSFGGVYLTTDYDTAVEAAEDAAEIWGGFPIIVKLEGSVSGTRPDEDTLLNFLHFQTRNDLDADAMMKYLKQHFTTNHRTPEKVGRLYDILKKRYDRKLDPNFWNWIFERRNKDIRELIDDVIKTLRVRDDHELVDRFRVERDIGFKGGLRITGAMIPYTKEEIELPDITFDDVVKKTRSAIF